MLRGRIYILSKKFGQFKLHGNTKSALLTAAICASGVFLINSGINVQAATNTNQNQAVTQASDTDLPEGISQDDVVNQGTCGTVNWYFTNDGTLYLMGGKLGSLESIDMDISLVTRIDTSKAKSPVIAPEKSSRLFGATVITSKTYFRNLTTADLSKMDTSNTTNMAYMFDFCSKLTSLDLSNFDTSNVTRMDNMFANCTGLKSVNLSSFNTSQVTSMNWMFNRDTLETLDVSNFDTSSVTDMSDMFARMPNLQNLDISGFDMSKVTNTADMFVDANIKSVTLGPKNKFGNGTNLTTTENNSSWVNVVDSSQPKADNVSDTTVDLSTIVPKYFDEHPETTDIMLRPSVNGEQLYQGDLTLPVTTQNGETSSRVIKDVIATSPGTVNLPDDNGYTPDPSSVDVTYDIKTDTFNLKKDDQVINYIPKSGTSITASVKIPITINGETDSSQPYIVVNDITGAVNHTVTVPVPSTLKDGSNNPNPPTVQAQVNKDGIITTNETVNYTSPEISGKVTIPILKDGKKGTVESDKTYTGKVGDTFDVDVPTIDGYNPDKSTVKATVNADKTITANETVTYTPVEKPSVTAKVSIPISKDGKESTIQTDQTYTGKIGETIDVTVPTIDGYMPDKSTVKATVNDDKTISTNETVTYTPAEKPSVTAKVSIPISKDGKESTIESDQAYTGKIGDTIDVTVPTIDGYNPDKSTVQATVNADKTISSDETVTYTKKSSGGSGSNTNNNNNNSNNNNNGNDNQNNVTVEYKDQTVATFNNVDNVPLYSRNSDDTMSRIGNRALARNSAWFSNKKLTINNESYYQVATNEYVRADQVYPYQSVNADIRTYGDSSKTLVNAYGDTSNRALAANSNWFTDRIATINGDKYYRVSTGEFVSVNDAYIYQVLNN